MSKARGRQELIDLAFVAHARPQLQAETQLIQRSALHRPLHFIHPSFSLESTCPEDTAAHRLLVAGPAEDSARYGS